MQLELPVRAMFDVCVPVHRRTERLTIDGKLTEWSDAYRLPDLAAMDGTPGYAEVYMAWDEQGLYFAVKVDGKKKVESHPKRPWKGDALFLWVDTRDVRDALRAGRFCHHFLVMPLGGGRGRSAKAWQTRIHRAREQAPICDESLLSVASRIKTNGYTLELAIPAEALNGYDPAECSRLGFTYFMTDINHGQQQWNVPPHLPFGHDPSTWAAIELVD